MRRADIECRLCRKRYDDTEHGCVTCLPAKQNIIWPENALPYLNSICAELIFVVEAELARVRQDQADSDGMDYDRVVAVQKLGSTMARILAEARQLERQNQEEVSRMTDEQKLGAFLDKFTTGMSPDAQGRLLAKLQRRVEALHAVDAEEAYLLED